MCYDNIMSWISNASIAIVAQKNIVILAFRVSQINNQYISP